MCFLDRCSNIREARIVAPHGRSLLTHDRINLLLGLAHDLGPLDEGLNSSQDNAGARVACSLHHSPAQEVQLVAIQLEFLFLVEHSVHEGELRPDLLPALFETGQHVVVQAIHSVANVAGPRPPVAKYALGDPVQEWEDVHRRRVPWLHDHGPVLHQLI